MRAQNPSSCTDWEFREIMNALVSEGNRQYDKSSRSGIRSMADAMTAALRARSCSGLLNRTDSLEYTADYLKLMGDWHYENGNYEVSSFPQAERFFFQALSIYQREDLPFREDLDKIPVIYRELAQLHYRLQRYPEALSDIDKAESAYADAWMSQLFGLEDPEYAIWQDLRTQQALCLARVGRAQEALRLIDKVLAKLLQKDELYYETLRKKAKILMLSGAPESAAPLYQSYFEWRRADALECLLAMDAVGRQEYWMRMRPFIADCYQLEDANPELLFNTALFGKGLLLQLRRNVQLYQWKDIQKRLPTDACVIEFVQYEKDGTRKMGALVLGRKGKPLWVPFAGPDEFFEYEINGRTNRERIYSTDGKIKNPMYVDRGLMSFLWNDALVGVIGTCKKVYFVPDGYLHQLAVEYMLPEGLSGKEFYRLTSSRRLMEDADEDLSSALIVGGVNYNQAEATPLVGNDRLAYAYMSGLQGRFGYLPASKKEAEAVHQLRNCPADTLLLGTAATEASVCSLFPLYRLVSLSTHGFFNAAELPQGTDLKPCLEDNSLSQSVLALSGANRSLSDEGFNHAIMDGLLSAAEIGRLNLTGVNLAILSACQTGLGMVTGDGVFGIQRGLKNAGAGSMVLSLWNVDDLATSLFMSRFHQLMADGFSIHKAFFVARSSFPELAAHASIRVFNAATLASENVSTPEDFRQPRYMNAFILIDAIN